MPVLAVDLGGTKTLVALVEHGPRVVARSFPTDKAAGPDKWLTDIADAVKDWRGKYAGIAFAVTGHVADGTWTALNTETLNLPESYPLADRLRALFGFDPVLANDAQAAAYGEFTHGAGQGEDLVFLTISTGIGGGIVANGQLIAGSSGLAGHFGQMRGRDGIRIEDRFSGRAMATQARALGHDMTVPEIFAAAKAGVGWAEVIFDASAMGVAALCADLKLGLDPARIVIGGGVGLAPGYLDRVRAHLETIAPDIRPDLTPAALGANAGILGISALHENKTTGSTTDET